jgi:hypothetical protein
LQLGTPPTAFTQLDLLTGLPATVTNDITDFGWEYVWHCHILGHEENDLMRPLVYRPVVNTPAAPSTVVVSNTGAVSWADPTPAISAKGNPQNEIGFRVERSQVINGLAGSYMQLATPALLVDGRVNTLANATSFQDAPAPFTDYGYRVVAVNESGTTPSSMFLLSQAPALPASLTATSALLANQWSVNLNWTDVATNETNYLVQRATGSINGKSGVVTWGALANLPTATSLLPSNLTNYADSGLANTLYQYQVHAVNGSLVGAVATAFAATATTLPAPGQLQIGGGKSTTSVTLQWQPVISTLGTGYEMQHCAGTKAQCTTGPQALWASDPGDMKAGLAKTGKVVNAGLAGRTTYQFRVRTVNALVPGLVSPWSAMFEAKTK